MYVFPTAATCITTDCFIVFIPFLLLNAMFYYVPIYLLIYVLRYSCIHVFIYFLSMYLFMYLFIVFS